MRRKTLALSVLLIALSSLGFLAFLAYEDQEVTQESEFLMEIEEYPRNESQSQVETD